MTIAVYAVVVITLIIVGITLGTKNNHENKKDPDKKEESVTMETGKVLFRTT